jgi:hypothetical protein
MVKSYERQTPVIMTLPLSSPLPSGEVNGDSEV